MNGNTGNKTTPEKTFAGSEEKSTLIKHAFIELNKVYEIKYLNANAVHFFKKERKKLIGKPLELVFPKIKFTKGYDAIVQANTKKLVVEVTYIEPPGSRVVNLLAQPTADGVCIFFSHSSPVNSEEQPFNLEDQYRTLVENTPDVITRWNKDLKLVYANKALEEKTGILSEFATGKSIHEIGQPDEITIPWTHTLQKVFKTNEPTTSYISILTPEGFKSFHSFLVPERNAIGQIQTVLVISRDITGLKKAEEEQKKAEEILNTINDACYQLDNKGNLVYLNRKAEQLFQLKKEEIIGRNIWHVFPQSIDNPIYDIIQHTALEKKQYAQIDYNSTLLNCWISLSVTPTQEGCIILFREIEDLKQTKLRLQESKDLLQTVYDASPNAICVFKILYSKEREPENFEILTFNQFTLKLTGLAPTDIIGKDYRVLYPEKICRELLEKFKETVRTEQSSEFELWIENGGIHYWYHFHVVKLKNLLIVNTEDITEAKRVERDLREQVNLIQTLSETIPDVISIIELPSRKVLYLNQNPLEVAGYSEVEFKNMMPGEQRNLIVHPDDARRFTAFYEQLNALADDDVTFIEYRFRHRDGTWHILYTRGKILKRNEKGAPSQALLIGQDITSRIKAEQELIKVKDELAQKATNMYLSLFNAIDEGFCILKAIFNEAGKPVDYLYVEVNPAFQKLSGIENVVGKTLCEVIPEVEPIWIESYGNVALTGKPIRFEAYVQVLEKWFDVYAFRIDQLEEGQMAVIFTNTTDRRKAEESLREKEDAFRSYVEASSDSVYKMSADWQTMFNLEGKDFLPSVSTSTQSWLNTYVPEHDKNRVQAAIDKAIRTKGIFELEHQVFDMQGNLAWTFSRALPRFNQQGEIIEWIGAASNITERKNAEVRQAYLLNLNDAIRTIVNPVEVEEVATKMAMDYFKADRCYYCQIEGDYAVIKRDALRGSLPSVAGRYPLSSFAIFKKVIDEGRSFVVNDAKTTDILDESLREICIALQVISFIDVPVIKNRKAAGILCLVQATPRNWTETEIELVAETAERTWAAVERAKIEEALRDRETELTTVQEIGGVGGIDIDIENGLRSWRSPEYLRLHGLPADTTLEQHEDWLKRLHPEDREQANLTLQNALTSNSDTYVSEYRIIRPNDGQTRWILAKGQIERDEKGQAVRLIGAHIDITTRKITEEILRESEEEKAYLLKLSDAIRLLDNPDEIRLAASFVLGEYLKADRAFYMEIIVQKDIEYYVINETYHTEKAPRRIGQFPTENFGRVVDVLRQGHMVVINDIENDPLVDHRELSRYAAISTRAFVVLPLIKNDELIAALAVHQAEPRVWKPSEIKLIAETAERTWASVERARAEEALNKAKENYLIQLEEEVYQRTAELIENQSLLQSVFDSSMNAINVAKAVRDKAGKIIDFEWVLVNSKVNDYSPKVDFIGKKYTEVYPSLKLSLAFDRYKQVAETGVADDFESYYEGEGLKGWYRNIVVKFGDGLLITTENITERKRTDLEIKESKNLLQSMMENTASSIMALKAIYNEENRIIDLEYVFTNSQALSSVNKTSLIGKRFLEEIPDESTHYLFKQYAHVIETGVNWRDNVCIDIDGVDQWIQVFATRMNGWCLVTYSDITLIKKTEQEFKRNRDLLQATLESSLNLVQVFEAVRNKEGSVVDFQWVMISGFTEAILGKVTGRRLLQLLPDFKVSGLFKKLVNVLQTGKPDFFEMYFTGHKDLQGWYDNVAVQLNDGVVLTSRNITERKNADDEVRKTLAILQQSEKIVQMGSWEYDVASGSFHWSDGMYDLFSIEKGEKVTPDIYRQYAVEEDSAIAEDLIDSIANSYREIEKNIRINKNGSLQILKVNSMVLRDSDGVPSKILGVDLNITEIVRSEEQLKQLNMSVMQRNRELEEKNAELASFAFIASHDLKEPLRKITVFSNMLDTKESQSLSSTGKEYLTRMKAAVQRMDLLIEDILSLSRLQSNSQIFERVDLNKVLQKTREEYAEQISTVGAVIESDKLPTITGSPSPLFYLFNNLINNALKFQRQGNKPAIRISASLVKGKDIAELSDRQEEDFYKISFADNGIGFDNVHARQIFQIFKRLHGKSEFPGTGIGLAICKKIMDIHHGYIASDSKINSGAIFSCYFPVDFEPGNEDESILKE